MTTGRINQVTIVSPGLAYQRPFQAPERMSKLLVGDTEVAPDRSTVRQRPTVPLDRQSAFPL